MTKLKLGPILDERPVKLTIEITAALNRKLEAYGEDLASDTGASEPIPPIRLAPAMLGDYVDSDPAFIKRYRARSRS